jgi:hypothetical protein
MTVPPHRQVGVARHSQADVMKSRGASNPPPGPGSEGQRVRRQVEGFFPPMIVCLLV